MLFMLILNVVVDICFNAVFDTKLLISMAVLEPQKEKFKRGNKNINFGFSSRVYFFPHLVNNSAKAMQQPLFKKCS